MNTTDHARMARHMPSSPVSILALFFLRRPNASLTARSRTCESRVAQAGAEALGAGVGLQLGYKC